MQRLSESNDLQAVRDERARRSYIRYVQRVFADVYGKPYQTNWHHELIADKLEEWAKPESALDRLMVFMGPQHGKTELCSRMLPGWLFGHYPDARVIGASYAASLATKLSRHAKRAMLCDTYKRLYPEVVIGDGDNTTNTATEWELSSPQHGEYVARGARQGVDGQPADYIIIDDPISGQMARSQADRDAVYDWYAESLRARLSKQGKVLIIMTRWHVDDLAGRLLDEARTIPEADQWEVLSLPAILDTEPVDGDPRKEGEPLWPGHKDRSDLEAIRKPNPDVFESLYQQRPHPPGGTIVKDDHIRYWEKLPGFAGKWVQSWDLRNGGKSETSSYAVAQLWFVPDSEKANCYLVDQKRGKWSFTETLGQMRRLRNAPQWERATEIIVEDKADGRALIPTLSNEIPGIVGINPGAVSKVARLEAVAPYFRSGNVYVPKQSAWTNEYVHEITNFPGTTNDDQVDATSQAVKHLLVPEVDNRSNPWQGLR